MNRDDFRFLVVGSDVAAELGISEGVTVIRSFDEPKVAYTGAVDADSVSAWVWQQSLPLVGAYTKETAARYKKDGRPLFKLYVDVDLKANPKQITYYKNRLTKAITDESKAKLIFAVVNKAEFKDEVDKFGIAGFESGVVIEDHKNSQKFRMDTTFDSDAAATFVSNWLAGSVKPYIRSQPRPTQGEGATVVVGETFEEIVMDPSKDVLIEFYAPWCGHCKKLEPKYNELAEKVKQSGPGNLVIAKMDATANDSPHAKYQARGYPTLFYAPANNKNAPITYSGDREVDAFWKWLKERSTAPAGSWK
jgi:protein disulfide isomerase family A protein 3